jgi:predicted transcriptional regulator
MTKLFEQAVEKVQTLPAEMQDEVARMLFAYIGNADESLIELTPEEEADLRKALAEVERGELATDAEVEAVFSKYRA